jgi:hypothetical protein
MNAHSTCNYILAYNKPSLNKTQIQNSSLKTLYFFRETEVKNML